jgi:hypothetical protein
MTSVRIPFDEKEAVRYFGARPGDREAALLVDQAFLFLRNELQPRSFKQHWKCRVIAGTDKQKGSVTLENGTIFHSSLLARHLAGCDELLLFGATLGSRFDVALRRLSLMRIALGAAGQAVGAALIETYCDEQEKLWKQEYPACYSYRTRFSPGYGDWDLGEQKEIFRVLDLPKHIGLTLTEGGLMAPVKSVTAVIGMDASGQLGSVSDGERKDDADKTADGSRHNCAACTAVDCPYRWKG